jgi:hypothetical protein
MRCRQPEQPPADGEPRLQRKFAGWRAYEETAIRSWRSRSALQPQLDTTGRGGPVGHTELQPGAVGSRWRGGTERTSVACNLGMEGVEQATGGAVAIDRTALNARD